MQTVHVKLKPIIDSIEISQSKLNLTDEEMKDMESLKEYIQSYHTPLGFEVLSVQKYDPLS